MPDMDGLALALRIRALGLTMPIVLLTSNPAERARGGGRRRTGGDHPETHPARPTCTAS